MSEFHRWSGFSRATVAVEETDCGSAGGQMREGRVYTSTYSVAVPVTSQKQAQTAPDGQMETVCGKDRAKMWTRRW